MVLFLSLKRISSKSHSYKEIIDVKELRRKNSGVIIFRIQTHNLKENLLSLEITHSSQNNVSQISKSRIVHTYNYLRRGTRNIRIR